MRTPLFAAAATLSLALSTGVTISVLTAAYGLLWKPLPYAQSERIGFVRDIHPNGDPRGVALTNLADFRESDNFVAMAAYRPRTFGLRAAGSDDRAIVIDTGVVTSELFAVLAVEPLLGRTFTEDEERADAPVIALNHELWVSRFAADPHLVGTDVLLNERPRMVLGILPEGFTLPMGRDHGRRPRAFIPIPHRFFENKRAVRTLECVARLRYGVSFEAANAELDGIARALAESFPDTNEGFSAQVTPLHSVLSRQNESALLWLAFAATGIVAIVAVNLTGLSIARFASCGREVGVRISLGAGAPELARFFLKEALAVGVAGAALGLFVAHWILAALPQLLPVIGGFTRSELTLDARSFLVALVAALGTVIALFAFPLWLSLRANLPVLLKRGSFTNVPAFRIRKAVVVAQVGLGVLLLHTTLLLGRSFVQIIAVDPGFEPQHALTFGIGLPEARYDGGAELLGFHRRLIDRLEAIPGVVSVGAGMGAVLAGTARIGTGFQREGESAPHIEWPSAAARLASPGYFQAMGVRLLRGRTFSWRDDVEGARVIVVNRAFERKFYPSADSIGERLTLSWQSENSPEGTLFEIVGVVADIRQLSLHETAVPEIVMPMAQFPTETEGAVYTIRSTREDPALAQAIRSNVDALDGTLEAINILPLSFRVEASVTEERVSLVLAGLIGSAALVLAAIGIYSVLALFVLRRRREIAVRMVLGARMRELRGMVVSEGARLAILGCALGAAGFALVAPAIRTGLHGVDILDLASASVTLFVITAVVGLATLPPTRAAGRTAPMEVLRDE